MIVSNDYEQDLPLNPWFDTKTGDFDKRSVEPFKRVLKDRLRACMVELCNVIWEDGEHDTDWYQEMNMSLVELNFSSSIKMMQTKTLSGEPCRYPVLGTFTPSKDQSRIGTITIYPKAIARSSGASVTDFATVFWSTLAHETFHAMHYDMFRRSDKTSLWDGKALNADRKTVVERLAREYEGLFLGFADTYKLDNTLTSALIHHQIDSDARHDLMDWPYAGASAIESSEMLQLLGGGSFVRLVDMSLKDWRMAADHIKAAYYMAKVQHRLGVL